MTCSPSISRGPLRWANSSAGPVPMLTILFSMRRNRRPSRLRSRLRWVGTPITRSGQRSACAGSWHGGATWRAARAARSAAGTGGASCQTGAEDRPAGRLRGQVARHLLEDRDVAVDGLVGVGDRQRPLLLAAGRHEDAAVHVEEPGELGQLLVLVVLEDLVVGPLHGRESDAPLRADPDRVGREP